MNRLQKARLLPLLAARIKAGGKSIDFAQEHRLNPQTVWAWAVKERFIAPKYRHATDPSGRTLQKLHGHLRHGGNIVEFATQFGVNKSTVSRWAAQLGWKCEVKWIKVAALRPLLEDKLEKALRDGESLLAFSRKHKVPPATTYHWASRLGWASLPVWVAPKGTP